ncbi:MAG: NupC/NupG family nucleoside CNT transporter [Oligoflexus sp.]
MSYLQGVVGLLVFMAIAYLLSENRRDVSLKFVLLGLILQALIAIVLLKIPVFQELLLTLNKLVVTLSSVTDRATQFMFGFLAGGQAPFAIQNAQHNYIVAFRVLPLIMVVSAISSVLFYWGILPLIIRAIAQVLVKTFRISGALGFGAASTVFLGTIEAPLMIRPYLNQLSRAELLSLLSCTMSTIAGTVMVLYASVISQVVDNAVGHMLVASMISIPAALLLSHLMCPGTSSEQSNIVIQSDSHSTLDALIRGTIDGLQMVLHIVAIIIVFFALIYLCNDVLGLISIAGKTLSVELILGTAFRPFMWFIGIPWEQTLVAGQLMATKVVLNEFVAYLNLAGMNHADLGQENVIRLTYALCGFANFASAGIVIGGLGALIPERRQELIKLTMKSLVIGNLATLMTAAMIGLIA